MSIKCKSTSYLMETGKKIYSLFGFMCLFVVVFFSLRFAHIVVFVAKRRQSFLTCFEFSMWRNFTSYNSSWCYENKGIKALDCRTSKLKQSVILLVTVDQLVGYKVYQKHKKIVFFSYRYVNKVKLIWLKHFRLLIHNIRTHIVCT